MFYFAVATPSGTAAFSDPGVSKHLGEILREWEQFLASPASAHCPGSWLGPGQSGKQALCDAANIPCQTSLKFGELFQCDPSADNYGFPSWDDLFTRRFRPEVRPVAGPNDDDVIVNPCESKRYNLASNVQLRDHFWAKGNHYSLTDMLEDETTARQFVGGTVYQSFLSTYSYHRFHAPVSGIVRRAYVLRGSYFTIPQFSGVDTRATRQSEKINPEEWQAWLAYVSARAVIVIEADNSLLGQVGFIAIGMVEVSSVDLDLQEGQHVQKGAEIGMFHFGGSSQCLLFEPGVAVGGFPTDCEVSFPVNGPVARLRQGC